MKFKALIAMIVLGSSSVAMASPSISFQARGQWSTGSVVRDHRQPRPYRAPVAPVYTNDFRTTNQWNSDQHQRDHRPVYERPVYEPRGLVLAKSVQFAGHDTRTIHVGPDAGRFAELRIEGVSGSPVIQQVWVQFDDGQENAFHNLNATVRRGESVVLTLGETPRAIRKIVMYAPGYGINAAEKERIQDSYYGYKAHEGTFRIAAM